MKNSKWRPFTKMAAIEPQNIRHLTLLFSHFSHECPTAEILVSNYMFSNT